MLSNQAQACSLLGGLASADAANTAAATGPWLAIGEIEGDLLVAVNVGTVTGGQIVPKLETADDDSGTNAVDAVPIEGAFTTVTTANDPLQEKRSYNSNRLKAYVRFVGTITTGPVQVAASIFGTVKNH